MKSIITNLRLQRLVALLFLIIVVAACKDDDDPSADSGNTYVNDWILENMEYMYLWNTDIPSSPNKNQDPESFFESLLSPEDRFSWIQDNYIELLNSLQGISKEAGYEFALYRESAGSSTVIAQVLYVKPLSPAETAGLKRGDVITHINSQQITISNYISLLDNIHENHTIVYKPMVVESESFDTAKTVSLTTVEYTEDPNHLSKVIDVDSKKIGYYVYNFFASGTDSDEDHYDTEMDAVFQDFKSQGITDLVLDLRFNSGGSETAANNLASLIGTGVNNTKVFYKREYNDLVENEILNDPQGGEEFLTSHFLTKSENIGSQLTGSRVYILTGSRTASASELIINSLKPYMDVFIIGDTTVGKNVGSVSIYEENDPKNTWGMQPIIMKAYNSLSQSDYSNGFIPNIANKDNSLFIYPLGDTRENLLSQAIAEITGNGSLGRVQSPKGVKDLIGHSLDYKRRSFNLFIETNLPFKSVDN